MDDLRDDLGDVQVGGEMSLSDSLSWPEPNYINPVTHPRVATILSCTFGVLAVFLVGARLWVRMRIQRNSGWDDWLMSMAIIPVIGLSVIIPLFTDVYAFNRHVWDIHPKYLVPQRKLIMAIESTFCFASGLIKISILLFYKRLGARAVSMWFIWSIRVTIGFIALYSISFTLVPILGCRPISAFWDQVNLEKLARGYSYTCFDEGADVVAAAIISSAQDLLTAILPTFIYWNLQIPIRQKVALFGVFALGYGVVAVGILRSYYSWQIFYGSPDISWVGWHSFVWSLFEIHMITICANAPSLRIFFRLTFKSPQASSARTLPMQNNSDPSRKRPSHSFLSTAKNSHASQMSLWGSKHGTQVDEMEQNLVGEASASQQCEIVVTTTIDQNGDIEMGNMRHPGHFDPPLSAPLASPKPSSHNSLQVLPQGSSRHMSWNIPRLTRPASVFSLRMLRSQN